MGRCAHRGGSLGLISNDAFKLRSCKKARKKAYEHNQIDVVVVFNPEMLRQ